MPARKQANSPVRRRQKDPPGPDQPAPAASRKRAPGDPVSTLAAERMASLQQIIATLSEALTVDEVAMVVVEQGIAALGAYAGSVLLLDDQKTHFRMLGVRGYAADVVEAWRVFPVDRPTPLTAAVAAAKPVYLSSPEELHAAYPQLQFAAESRAWVAVPLVVYGDVIGGMALSYTTAQQFGADERVFIETLAHQCAQALERARLFAAERAARSMAETAWKRVKLLSEASVLLATTLDYDATLSNVTRLILPQFADYCVVHLFAETEELALAAVAHVDPNKEALVREMNARYPARVDPPVGTGMLLARGESLLLEPIPETLLHDMAVDVAHERYMRELSPVSSLFVPLRSRGQLLGSIMLSMAESGRHYTPNDLAIVEELARRAAGAIDKALLYRDAQRAKEAAERAAARTMRLQAVTASLSEALTAEDVAEVIVRAGSAAFQAHAGAVYLLTDDRTAFELLSYTGYDAEAAPAYRRAASDRPGPLKDAVVTRDIVVVETAAELVARWPHLKEAQSQSGDVATVAVPLLAGNRVFGVLYLAFRAERHFAPEDRVFLNTLGQQCAQALQRAQLYEDERRARAASEAAVQMRDFFLMTASHELRTPLTSLLGYADLLERRAQRSDTLPERERRILRVIVGQAERLARLISALLDIGRIQSGDLRIERAPVDLSALAQRCVAILEPVQHLCTISCVVAPEPVVVEGDAVRLEQVIDNLLQNAIKYSPNGGAITVRVDRHANQARVQVSDQGIGIPSEALDHIFSKFYRASNIVPQQIAGFGIGLSVVAEIVKLHGGTIAVQSTVGTGSTFVIELPLHAQG